MKNNHTVHRNDLNANAAKMRRGTVRMNRGKMTFAASAKAIAQAADLIFGARLGAAQMNILYWR